MNERPRRMIGRLSATFCAIIITLETGLWLLYQQQSTAKRVEIENSLAAIAELKAHELALWRKERRSDSQAMARNPLLARQVQLLLQDPTRLEVRKPLLQTLKTWRELQAYASITLTDNQGRRLFSEEPMQGVDEDCALAFITQARQQRQAVFADLHRATPTNDIHLAVIAPILAPDSPAATAECLALLVLRIDPQQFLYPLIQSWPLPSASAETLLVRREGAEVVFLNELRHRKNTALALRLPLTQTNLPAAQAVLKHTGTLVGEDYRGVPVLSSFRSIPESPWALVAKVDAEEIFAPLKTRARAFGLLGVLLLIMTGTGLYIWRSRSHIAFYKRQLIQERERLALVQHFDYLTKFANDAITLANADLQFVEVNERACALYGYTREEFLRLRIPAIRATSAQQDLAERLRDPQLTNGLVVETLHQRKDGTTFPVEVSMRLIEVEDTKFYQAIIRDISERKAQEREIARMNRLYAALSQVNQSIVRVRSREELFREVCRVLIEFGKFKMAWVGWWNQKTQDLEVAAVQGDETGYTSKIHVKVDDSPEGQGPGATAIRQGKPYISNDFAHDPHTLPWREATAAAGLGSSVALPIRLGGEVVGAVMVYASETSFFGAKELALLEEAAMDISFAMDHLQGEQQRQQAEEARKESEEHFRTIIEHAESGYFRLDEQGRFAYVNIAWLRMHGYASPAEVIGQHFALTQLPQDMKAAEQVVARVMKGEGIATGTFSRKRRDGSTGYHTFSVNPVRSRERITGMEGFLIDITDLKKTEDALRESEVRFHSLFTTMTEGLAVHRMVYTAEGRPQDYVILDVNPAFESQTGLTRSAVVGKRATEAYGVPAAPYLDVYAKVAQTLQPVTFEEYFAPMQKHFHITVYAPQMGFFVTVFEDITAHKHAEEALQSSEERYRTLVEASPDRIVMIDPQLKVLFASPRARSNNSTHAPEELVGHSTLEFFAPQERERAATNLALAFSTGAAPSTEYILLKKDGSAYPAEISLAAMRNTSGKVIALMGIVRDITIRKRAEEQLRALSARQEAILSSVPDIIMEVDRNRIYTWANRAGEEFFGTDVIGKEAASYFEGEQPTYEVVQPIFNGGAEIIYVESWQRRKDGQKRLLAWWCRTLKDAAGKVTGALSSAQDITERKQAEEQLHLQSAMLQAAANGILIADHKGTILWINDAFTKLTGYSAAEAVGQNPRILKAGKQEERFYQKMWATIFAGEVWHGELINQRKDGTLYTEEMTITPVRDAHGAVSHFIAIKQDVSERRALEESVQQAQKMDSIGRLAGGVAHDFNNVLQTILGFTDLLLVGTSAEDKRHSDLLEIQKAGQHAADLTHQLLAFSRKQMITPRVLDLNKTLADSEKMLHRLLGEDVHVHLQLDTQLPRTVADPGQVHQIIMNLAVNARDAMPNGGEFTFRTTPVEFHEQDLAAMPDVQSGRYVCLAVSDTGHGMSREVQEHIFEPFFTTKGLGKGTGLGLAVIYGIVKQSRGWIHVYSQKGLGTTFKVYLPAHVCELTATNRLSKEAGPTLAPGKGERILLVEDEPSVRALAHRICLKAGYKVTVCVNAQEGFDQWTKAGGAFDLLFSDVVLPDFTGIELAERLRAQRPTLPVLLCSGYSDERSRWSAIAEKKFHYLQKPYPASTLLQAIRQALTVQAA